MNGTAVCLSAAVAAGVLASSVAWAQMGGQPMTTMDPNNPAAQQAWRSGGYGYYGYPNYGYPSNYAYGYPYAYNSGYPYANAYGYSYDSENPFAAVTAAIAALTAPVTALAAPVAQAAVAPFAVATSGTAPLITGRSVAIGQMGKMCSTPVKSCELYQASYVGNGCSCKVTGGRSRGTVTP